MNFKKYKVGALRTESTLLPLTDEVESRGLTNRGFHAIIGINTEVGEILAATDNFKYKEWDKVNILEEIGDTLWYLAILIEDYVMVDYFNAFIKDLCYPERLDKKRLRTEISDLNQEAQLLLDHSKKVMFYGKEFDREMIETEVELIIIILFNIAQTISKETDIEILISNIFKVNLAKLKQRYPDKFDKTYAEIRDLESERKILKSI